MARYLHVYLWRCQLHTAGVWTVQVTDLEEGEDFEPCSCSASDYIPLADLSLDRKKVIKTYCPRCGEVMV